MTVPRWRRGERMGTDEAKAIYKNRAATAEASMPKAATGDCSLARTGQGQVRVLFFALGLHNLMCMVASRRRCSPRERCVAVSGIGA